MIFSQSFSISPNGLLNPETWNMVEVLTLHRILTCQPIRTSIFQFQFMSWVDFSLQTLSFEVEVCKAGSHEFSHRAAHCGADRSSLLPRRDPLQRLAEGLCRLYKSHKGYQSLVDNYIFVCANQTFKMCFERGKRYHHRIAWVLRTTTPVEALRLPHGYLCSNRPEISAPFRSTNCQSNKQQSCRTTVRNCISENRTKWAQRKIGAYEHPHVQSVECLTEFYRTLTCVTSRIILSALGHSSQELTLLRPTIRTLFCLVVRQRSLLICSTHWVWKIAKRCPSTLHSTRIQNQSIHNAEDERQRSPFSRERHCWPVLSRESSVFAQRGIDWILFACLLVN